MIHRKAYSPPKVACSSRSPLYAAALAWFAGYSTRQNMSVFDPECSRVPIPSFFLDSGLGQPFVNGCRNHAASEPVTIDSTDGELC